MPDKFTTLAGQSIPEVHESVNETIAFLTRWESPLLAALGFPTRVKNVFNPRHEWLEESLVPDSTTVNGAQTAGDTTIEVAAGTGTRFREGQILQVDGSRELFSIDVGGVAANQLTVTRGINGTTAEAIEDGATITVISDPATECEDAPESCVTTRDREENFTQIFRKVAGVCRTAELSDQIGIGTERELEHQIMMVERHLIRELAKTVINGRQRAVNPAGTATTTRNMDGIIQRILKGADPVIVDAGGQTLDEFILNLALQQMWERGANPMVLAVGPGQRRTVSALIEGRQRFDEDSSQLGAMVNRFISDFAVLEIIDPDKFIPKDVALILDLNRIDLVKLGGQADIWERIPIGRTGLSERVEIVGEFGLQIMNAGDGGHALIQNLG